MGPIDQFETEEDRLKRFDDPFGPNGGDQDLSKKPLRPMPSWIDYGEREVDPSLYHIGNGFLEIGGISMLIGQSYVGKSTFLTQLSINGAIGRDWLMFKFARALKFLIVQAEDPENKLVKMGQMFRRMGLTNDEIAQVRANTPILTIRGLTGNEVVKEIERHAEVLKPDVVAINPLTSFCPSVYKDEEINYFLRVLFSGMLDRQRCSGYVVAHPPKPVFDKEPRELTQFELQYSAAGMAAITNVTRSNMFLTHVNDDVFRLTVGKGFDDLGISESVATIRRSTDQDGIMLWERCDSKKAEEANEKEAQRKSKKRKDQFIAYDRLLKCFKVTEKYPPTKVIELAKKDLMKGKDWAKDAMRQLVLEKKLAKSEEHNPKGQPFVFYHLPTILEPAE